jgi:DNA-binding IscR family transcriptional regulator
VLALEGKIAPMGCLTDVAPSGRIACSHEGDLASTCSTKLLWMRVQGGIISALQRTTLAELVEFSRCSDPEPVGVTSLPVIQAR